MAERIYKLLIVDDEAEIRDGINRSIPWGEHGITVVGLATNGREALRLIGELEPDMMLLDIRMPVMNGLEVLEKLSAGKRQPKIIILSGYDDFEYCQTALRNGVSDYLLKPCRPKEILAVIKKLKEQISSEEKQASRWEYLQRQFRENIDLLREKLLIYLIQHEKIDLDTAKVRWRLYEMEIDFQNIGVALVRIDNLKKLEGNSGQELELVKLAVRNAFSGFMRQPPSLRNMICDYEDDLLALWNIDEESPEKFEKRMESFRQYIEANFAYTVTIGLGETAADIGRLFRAFNSALLAVEHGFWEGPNRIIRYDQVEEERLTDYNISLQEENAILQCVRTNDPERLEPALANFFHNLTSQGGSSKDYVQKMVTALICSIYHVCVERGLNTEKYFGANLAILDELPRTETLVELKQKILECLKMIIEEHPSHKSQWKMVNNALKYMEEHYLEELSLENVAQQVFVSPGYLSTIFKQALRKNFVDSLHEIRINKAKELLREVHLKVYEVAMQVGYKDEKYFSQIFKKIVGMTPNQYRDTIQ